MREENIIFHILGIPKNYYLDKHLIFEPKHCNKKRWTLFKLYPHLKQSPDSREVCAKKRVLNFWWGCGYVQKNACSSALFLFLFYFFFIFLVQTLFQNFGPMQTQIALDSSWIKPLIKRLLSMYSISLVLEMMRTRPQAS